MACTNGPHSHKFCACCCLTQTYHCRQTALEALRAWPGGLHMGGGVSTSNAKDYLDAGASHVIVTSFVFRDGELDQDRLQQLVSLGVGKGACGGRTGSGQGQGPCYCYCHRLVSCLTEGLLEDSLQQLLMLGR